MTQIRLPKQQTLLSGVTTVSTGTAIDLAGSEVEERYFVCKVAGTGAVSATVLVEVSSDNVTFFTMATITLSGTTSDSDGFISEDGWQFVRGRVTAISGTDAAVTLTMAV